jgi:hypothetical protein
VARFDEAGEVVWALRFGGAGDDAAFDVALDGDGSALVAGAFSATLDLAEPVEREDETGFAARIGPAGAVEWVRAFGGPGTSRALQVVIDDDGNVISGGSYRDGVDLGGGELPSDTDDGFVTGLSAGDGSHLFSRRIARFNFGGLARRGSELFVAGTCEGVCAVGGEVVAPQADGRLLVAKLSTDPASHGGSFANAADLYVEGTSHAVTSAVALPGSDPENPQGMTLVLSSASIGCASGTQIPRSIANGAPRRSEPELALLLQSAALSWHDVTSWFSHDGGGSGGSALVLVESITETEIVAYVEHHEEATGSSDTASYVIGKVTFQRCF